MTATILDRTSPPMTELDDQAEPSPVRTWVRDARVMARRNLLHVRREPMQLSDVTIQPALFVLLFTYVFGSAMVIAGGTYKDFAIPGLLVMILVTATPGTAVGVSQDLSSGVIDRFRTLPTASSTILAGRSVSDILSLVLACVIVAITGLLIGWRPDASLVSVVAGFGLVLLFAYAVSWGMLCLGLTVADPESAQATSFLLVFVPAFLSYAFVPTGSMPTVLRVIADWNPISAVSAAARDLMGSPNPSAASAWPLEHALPMALGWTALMLVAFVPLAVRTFRRRTTD
jgi:ABC-2 type transport system permease protein